MIPCLPSGGSHEYQVLTLGLRISVLSTLYLSPRKISRTLCKFLLLPNR
ncbi:unnamed protein product, partial [Arabidopsis halleri]